MSDEILGGESRFVVHRLRAKPIEYSVTISHFVRDGQWVMGVTTKDVAMDRENLLRVAADLHIAARWIEEDHGVFVEQSDNPVPPLRATDADADQDRS